MPVILRIGAYRYIGFPPKELRKLQSMVIENQTQLLEAWHEYFGN